MLLWRQKKVWYIESLGWIKFELGIKRLQKKLKRSCNGNWPELQRISYFPFQIFLILKSRITFSSIYLVVRLQASSWINRQVTLPRRICDLRPFWEVLWGWIMFYDQNVYMHWLLYASEFHLALFLREKRKHFHHLHHIIKFRKK